MKAVVIAGGLGTRLAEQRELEAFNHTGFWLAMDTVRDRAQLEELWATSLAQWKAWA